MADTPPTGRGLTLQRGDASPSAKGSSTDPGDVFSFVLSSLRDNPGMEDAILSVLDTVNPVGMTKKVLDFMMKGRGKSADAVNQITKKINETADLRKTAGKITTQLERRAKGAKELFGTPILANEFKSLPDDMLEKIVQDTLFKNKGSLSQFNTAVGGSAKTPKDIVKTIRQLDDSVSTSIKQFDDVQDTIIKLRGERKALTDARARAQVEGVKRGRKNEQ